MPKARSDRARPRRMPPDVIEMLLSIKRDAPGLSVRQVIERARNSGEVQDDMPLSNYLLNSTILIRNLTFQRSFVN